MSESTSNTLTPYLNTIEFADLLTELSETLGDYGSFEVNLRSATTAYEGVAEVKRISTEFLAKYPAIDKVELYEYLYQELITAFEEEDDDPVINGRLANMLYCGMFGKPFDLGNKKSKDFQFYRFIQDKMSQQFKSRKRK